MFFPESTLDLYFWDININNIKQITFSENCLEKIIFLEEVIEINEW